MTPRSGQNPSTHEREDAPSLAEPKMPVKGKVYGKKDFPKNLFDVGAFGLPLTIPQKVQALAGRLVGENPLWGVPRIQSEFRLPGNDLADTTASAFGRGNRIFGCREPASERSRRNDGHQFANPGADRLSKPQEFAFLRWGHGDPLRQFCLQNAIFDFKIRHHLGEFAIRDGGQHDRQVKPNRSHRQLPLRRRFPGRSSFHNARRSGPQENSTRNVPEFLRLSGHWRVRFA
jgi:hypothetical protein